MEKIKSLLPGHSHSAIDGGSSYPHSSKASDGKDHTPLPGTSTHAPHGHTGGAEGSAVGQHSATHDTSLPTHGESSGLGSETPLAGLTAKGAHPDQASIEDAVEKMHQRGDEHPFRLGQGTEQGHQHKYDTGSAAGSGAATPSKHHHDKDRDVTSTHGTHGHAKDHHSHNADSTAEKMHQRGDESPFRVGQGTDQGHQHKYSGPAAGAAAGAGVAAGVSHNRDTDSHNTNTNTNPDVIAEKMHERGDQHPFRLGQGTEQGHEHKYDTGAAAAAGGAAIAAAGAKHHHDTNRDLESAPKTHGTQETQSMSGGASGLETRDPYAAAQQAGALPDRTDISAIDREVAAGGVGGATAGHSSTQQPISSLREERHQITSMMAASSGLESSQKRYENDVPAHGLNPGVNDPVSLRGQAPVSEPIHQDPSLMGASTGQAQSSLSGHGGLSERALGGSAVEGQSGLSQSGLGQSGLSQGGLGGPSLEGQNGLSQGGLSGSSVGGQDLNAGQGAGSGGLIHGHHTTMTGEMLDPHIGGSK
ncbi:hypothetical protein LTR56_020128 [Elasticomyces elasticus]|nr:hypothetical protein LTR56_020128 [Elasticomyces elasticus]KAK3633590.1 hypothetical protein LTR22_020026 [Elasticomyces elasticus]KAK4910801.1 hypothetical protein LTR49_020575 [Elasticomyces elasticus]KAK5760437.1 hypothetical protein LTS12_009481 [Elasticomyces elasticus]